MSLLTIRDEVTRRQPHIVQFLRDIVSIPSLSCQEERVVRRIAEEMRATGFDEVRFDAVGNVIGRIGSGPVKILFDSHIDTVGTGEISAWEGRDPFDPILRDGKIWGRGVVDEKAGMATTLHAAALLKKLGLTERCCIWVVGSVIEEDCDGLSLLHLIEQEHVRPDYVILSEPTNLDVHRGHRGRVEMTITVRGRSAHAAHCDAGLNALYKMAPILRDIEELHARLAHDPFLGKGSVTASFLDVRTPSLNSVPDAATLFIDRRLTQGETVELALEQIRRLPSLGDASVEVLQYRGRAWTGRDVQQEKVFPTWVLPEDHLLVRAAAAAVEQARGAPPKVSRWVFSTNGVATMGRLGIPTIGFAPGREELAHTTQEAVEVSDLLTATIGAALIPNAIADQVLGSVPLRSS